MKRTLHIVVLLVAGCLAGCEIDSADSVARSVGLDVAGFYRHPNHPAQTLVAENTGAATTSLQISQAGDQLEARDNNSIRFTGTIGDETDSAASFTLEGQTTAGQSATISGTISVEGGQATLRGTWIEPSLYSTVYGVATVPTNVVDVLRIEPPSATISVNSSVEFTILGGYPGGTVTLSDKSLGTLASVSDNVVRYTAGATPGTNIITAKAKDGRTATATVIQK